MSRSLVACFSAALLVLLLGCPDPRRTEPQPPVPTAVTSLETWSSANWTLVPDGNPGVPRSLTFSVDLTSTPGDLYFVFTNTSTSPTPVSLASLAVPGGQRTVGPRGGIPSSSDPEGPFLDRPGDQRFVRNLPADMVPSSRPRVFSVDAPYTPPSVGEALTFEDYTDTNGVYRQIPAHLRFRSGPYHGRLLCLWVADDVWTDAALSGAPNNGTQPGLTRGFSNAMASAYGGKFLNGTTSDIYSSVTAVFGREWSDSGSPGAGLVDGHGEVHILVANLNPTGASSYPAGYYSSGHIYTHDGTGQWWDHSNQKLMFFLNSDSLSAPDGGMPWTLGSDSSRYMVSALAHEFQHMVHFYQKSVLRSGSSDSWVNEMSSMVAEDLVSDRIGVEGPRGVLLQDGAFDYSAGYPNTNWGRLDRFVGTHTTTSLTHWTNLGLDSYANAYAFGAWAVRNFGGPALFRTLVQSSGGDADAVAAAVNLVSGRSETFASLTRWWGLATLLQKSSGSSDPINWGLTPSNGTFPLTGAVGGDPWVFRLGSIDLSRYRHQSGPDWVTGMPFSLPGDPPPSLPAGASWFQRRLVGATGVHPFTLLLPASIQVTAVQLR